MSAGIRLGLRGAGDVAGVLAEDAGAVRPVARAEKDAFNSAVPAPGDPRARPGIVAALRAAEQAVSPGDERFPASDPSPAAAGSGRETRGTTTTRYEPSPVPELGGGGGGATGAAGLYVGAGGLYGALCGLMSFFFGFFFSRPRTSRLPMICSPSC